MKFEAWVDPVMEKLFPDDGALPRRHVVFSRTMEDNTTTWFTFMEEGEEDRAEYLLDVTLSSELDSAIERFALGPFESMGYDDRGTLIKKYSPLVKALSRKELEEMFEDGLYTSGFYDQVYIRDIYPCCQKIDKFDAFLFAGDSVYDGVWAPKKFTKTRIRNLKPIPNAEEMQKQVTSKRLARFSDLDLIEELRIRSSKEE